jgi:hypothetical protein
VLTVLSVFPQVLPVASCAGSPRSVGGRPSATLRLRLGPEGGAASAATSAHSTPRQHGSRGGSAPAAGGEAEPMAEAALRPVTLWLGLPLLARLEAFAEPLLLAAAEATAAAAEAAAAAAAAAAGQRRGSQRVAFESHQGGQQPQGAAHKTAVAAAIDSILDSLQVLAGAVPDTLSHVYMHTMSQTVIVHDHMQLHFCMLDTHPCAVILQEFGTDRQPKAPAAAQRRFGVSVSAAHVSAVLALPPPLGDAPAGALYGHRYLALDLFPVSAPWQGPAYSRMLMHEAATFHAAEKCRVQRLDIFGEAGG